MNLNVLNGQIIKSELLPGILPPVFSKFISFTKHTVYMQNTESGCTFGVCRSKFVKDFNKGEYQVINPAENTVKTPS